MIWALVRRDGALRSLMVLGPLMLCNAGLLLAVLVTRTGGAPDPALLAGVGWISVAVQLLVGTWKVRGGPLELALPISGRHLWLARVTALALSGFVIAAGFVLLVALAPLDTAPVGLGALLVAATSLGAVLLQTPRPSLDRVPRGARGVAWSAAVVIGLLAAVVAAASRAGTGAGILLAACIATLAMVGVRVPPALAVAPKAPEPAPAVRAGRAEGAARGPVWTVLLRCVSAGPQELLALGALIFFGLILGGVASSWSGEPVARDVRFQFVTMGSYVLYAFVGPRLNGLSRLDPLPVPRRALFAAFILPSLLVLGLSYGTGALLAARFDRTEYLDFAQDEDGVWRVGVPLRLFELSWAGAVPVATAPWGESHPGIRLPMSREGRAAITTAFVPGPGASARFVAWQLSRAAKELYGLSVPEEEVLARLDTAPDGTVVGRAPSLGLRASRPDLAPRSGPIFPAIAAQVTVPWLLLAGLLFATHRPGVPGWARQAVYWGGLALLLLLFAMGSIATIAFGIEPWAPRALVEIPMWALGRMAGGTILAWAGGALAILGAVLLAGRAFRRMEVPARPTRYSLLERLKEEGC